VKALFSACPPLAAGGRLRGMGTEHQVHANCQPSMNKTNPELWAEIVRTANLLRLSEPQLKSMEAVAAGVLPPDKVELPVHYVSDAMILTRLILSFDAREGAGQ
jgi:hypothetical protein